MVRTRDLAPWYVHDACRLDEASNKETVFVGSGLASSEKGGYRAVEGGLFDGDWSVYASPEQAATLPERPRARASCFVLHSHLHCNDTWNVVD